MFLKEIASNFQREVPIWRSEVAIAVEYSNNIENTYYIQS